MAIAQVDALDREAVLLRTLAHPARLPLLEALSQGEECVCHLTALLDRPQPYVSKQLAELREAGLVSDRRDAQRIYYRLVDERVVGLLEAARAVSGRRLPVGQQTLPGCPCPRCS